MNSCIVYLFNMEFELTFDVAEGVIKPSIHKDSNGIDICVHKDTLIKHMHATKVGTGIRMKFPKGWNCIIHPKSGRTVPKGMTETKDTLDIRAGVIDWNYRGEVQVVVFNYGEDKVLKAGSPIAQLIFSKSPDLVNISYDKITEDTSRGANGFGSSYL